jgi:hypothetical protein
MLKDKQPQSLKGSLLVMSLWKGGILEVLLGNSDRIAEARLYFLSFLLDINGANAWNKWKIVYFSKENKWIIPSEDPVS